MLGSPTPFSSLLGPPRGHGNCSETSDTGGSCLAFDQRQAESGRLFAHRGDLTGTAALVICLGAQVAKRGAMGAQVIDEACDLVGRGDNRRRRTEASAHAPVEGPQPTLAATGRLGG
jgi:hypothetical protein